MGSTNHNGSASQSQTLLEAPYPGGDLDGWHLEEESDDSVDDRLLVGPDGTTIETWREGYPYEQRMTREEYERTKRSLQIELLKLQSWIKDTGQKVVLVFEGRDAAGKGGTIKRFTEHLNPRGARVVALEKPTEREEHMPEAGPRSITHGDILAIIPTPDAMVTDVSSVRLDWLYLRTDKPIFLTDRHHDAERLRHDIPVSRCADVIDDVDVEQRAALITASLEHDEHHIGRVAMRHHYFDDLQVRDSTAKFLDAVSEVVTLRDRLLGAAPTSAESTAITA